MRRNHGSKTPVYKKSRGPTLGVISVPILEQDGLYFKDLERTGVLCPYADWRLTPEERARDLAPRLSVEELAGLMMYSLHQLVPGIPVRKNTPNNGPIPAQPSVHAPSQNKKPCRGTEVIK